MIDDPITINLPAPWSQGSRFETNVLGPINYLVGPNGSGKSRFAAELPGQLKSRRSGVRLLGTDRLREMADPGTLGRHWGDNLRSGYAKRMNAGAIIDQGAPRKRRFLAVQN